MTGRRAVVGVLVLVATSTAALGAPAAAGETGPRGVTVATLPPCPNGRPIGPGVACTGPRVHHSGSSTGAITIAVSVVVGLGVAVGAWFVVRRRLALDAATPRVSRPRRPS